MRVFLLFAVVVLMGGIASPAPAQTRSPSRVLWPTEAFSAPLGIAPLGEFPAEPTRLAREAEGPGPVLRMDRPPRQCEIIIVPVPCAEYRRWLGYTGWGMGIGGAAGLAYGLTQDDDNEFLDLSPVIETAIGAGIGFYAGTAVFLLRSVR